MFAHAGLNFEIEDIFEDEAAMLWIRGFEEIQPKLGTKLLIYGHTPKPLANILTQKGNCINLDGGCVFAGKSEGMGYLVALVLETKEFIYVQNCE